MRRLSWSYRSKQTVEKVTPQTSRTSIYIGRLLIKEQFPCMWGLGSRGRALSSGVNARISNKTVTKRVVISNSHKRVGKHVSFCTAMTIMVVRSKSAQSRPRPKISLTLQWPIFDSLAIASHWLCYCIVLCCTKRVDYKEVITAISTACNIHNAWIRIRKDYSQAPKE